ncbi:hypothetical protein N7448_006282 [Penicillium atrosanguineum]|nr:hypothetical protein N7448_006282 [Penicillium atrosanguineum]
MTPELMHPWIAQVVGVCLSFYLGESPRSAIEIEDDGASLHFNVINFTDAAIVAEWGLGSLSDTAVLMDSNNQIDATISQESLATLQVELESLKPIDGPKKHRIKLLDFRLVFQYSTADVRLHINQFCIDWDNGPLKYLPTKKLRKEKTLRSVLERARQKATNSRRIPNPNIPVSPVPRPDESVTHNQYQPDERQSSPVNAVSSQQLFSQMPRDDCCTGNPPSKPGRSLLRAPAELLQRLMPSSRSFFGTTSRDSLPRQDELSDHKGSTQPICGDDRVANKLQLLSPLAPRLNDRSQGSAFASRIGSGSEGKTVYESFEPLGLSSQRIPIGSASDEDEDKNSVSSQIPRGGLNDATVHEANRTEEDSLATQHPATQPLHAVEGPFPRKRQRESVDTQPKLADDENARQKSKGDSPLLKRQRIDIPQATLKELPEVGKPAEDKSGTSHAEAKSTKADYVNPEPAPICSSRSNRVNPWEGIEMIASNEVFIPKDQANLLEEKLWIPPMPNEQMPQGHVPPSLLRQWNSIAERRHRQTEEAKPILEQPPTPTQDTVMSSDNDDSGSEGTPIDWTPTPEKSRFENRLPDSSPVRQSSFIGIKPVPSLGWNAAHQANKHDYQGDATGFKKGFNRLIRHTEASQSASGESAAEDPRSLEGNDADADKIMASVEASLIEFGQGDANLDQSDHSLSLEGQASYQAPELSEKSPTQLSSLESAIQPNQDDSGDESDESIMDTSVPLGLGESWPDPTQSTQVERDAASSGASLPGANGNRVQVVETPANNNGRLRGNEPSNQESELRPPHTQMPSSQAKKTSSPSRVLNTYPYYGSYEKSQISNEGLDPSSHPTGDGSPRIDVEGTQTQNSSTNVPSQNTTQSQEIVLDSSGPAYRHQNIPWSGQQATAEPLCLLFASSNEPASTQLNEQNQRPMEGYISPDVPMISSQVSTTGCFNIPVPDQDYSPSKSQRILPLDNETVSEKSTDTQNTQNAALVARRLAHIGNPEKVAQAKEIYKRFCDDYSAYTGDFDHFIELCSRLQAVRADGKLQRSFLWDDFIIMHLQQYSSHIEQRVSQDSTTLMYEEFFLLNFTHPIHRKRSLAAHSVEIAASQFIPTELVPLIASSQVQLDPPAAQNEVTVSSFATNLAENPPNLHAEPIKEVTLGSLPDTVSPYFVPSSPVDSVSIKVEGLGSNYHDSRDDPIYSMESDETRDVKPTLHSLEPSFEQPPDNPHDVRNDADDDHVGEIEETDLEDTYHETASVELGDESFLSTPPASSSRALPIPVMSPEAKYEDENWFVSLRHIRPKGPVWSDDHNTPFKRYAEADQNVLTDRLRRGGAKILLDDKGVIRRAIHRC